MFEVKIEDKVIAYVITGTRKQEATSGFSKIKDIFDSFKLTINMNMLLQSQEQVKKI